MRLLRLPELLSKIALSRPSFERLIRADPTFPPPVRPLKSDRRWREDEVDAWIAALPHDEARAS
jgi:predicted DNA-binding transcriptional regulator AlpA